MSFTVEETGLEPAATPSAPAASVFDEIIGTVTGRPATATPSAPAAPSKVAQAAEAVSSTASSMWQGVKQAVGLPATPAQPAAPATATPSYGAAVEQLVEMAESQGVTPQQAAAVVQQQAAAVQQQAATPFYLNPAFIVVSTVGSIGLTWLLVKAFSKPKARAA